MLQSHMPAFTALVTSARYAAETVVLYNEAFGLIIETGAAFGTFAARKVRDATRGARNFVVQWIEGEEQIVERIVEGDNTV